VDGGLALSSLTLQQQTKREMEKSLCTLAAVVFLGGFLDAAPRNDSTAEMSSLLNNTRAVESVSAQPQERAADRPRTKLSTRDKQNTKNISRDSEGKKKKKKEEDDSKTENTRTQPGMDTFTLTLVMELWTS